MDKVYLDNAASTQIDERVIEAIIRSMKEDFGNPSAIHNFGQESKSKVETVRKYIAKNLKVQPNEIIFTSCGTESNNFILRSCVENLSIKRIITTNIEHKSVGETIKDIQQKTNIEVIYLPIDLEGNWELSVLEKYLQQEIPTLVSLMHANNEVGNLIDIKATALLCKKYNAWFHSDTVQTMGHYLMDFSEIPIDFASCSAHKFHGPKGIGFAFIRKTTGLKTEMNGGGQERGMRSGTENVPGIVGLGKAFSLAIEEIQERKKIIEELKDYTISQLKEKIKGIKFNGLSQYNDKSLYTLVSLLLPFSNSMIGFQLDMKGIAISQGSACSSGAVRPSNVILHLYKEEEVKQTTVLRVSFSHYNTKEDIDRFVNALEEIATQYS